MFEPWEILSTRAINCLINELRRIGVIASQPGEFIAFAELDAHAQAIADLGKSHWEEVPECGRVTMWKIERWLNAHGIEFK